jgi:hypothetical protein
MGPSQTTRITLRSIVHNHRWGLGLADGDSAYDELEKGLARGPVIAMPTITLEGDASGAPHPDPTSYAGRFADAVFTVGALR